MKQHPEIITVRKWIRSVLLTCGTLGLLLFIVYPPLIMGDSSESSQYLHQSFPVHSALETIIGLTAILLGFSLWSRREDPLLWDKSIIAFGLWPMGIITLFHSVVTGPDEFVLLYSSAMLAGALGFVLCWFPALSCRDWPKTLTPWIIMASAALFSGIVVATSSFSVSMVEEGSFTLFADSINFAAGVLFALAALKIFQVTSLGRNSWILLLLGVISVSGAVAGFTFPFSQAWSQGWWVHHILRLSSYIGALVVLQRSGSKAEREQAKALQEKIALADELSVKSERLALAMEAARDGIWDWDLESDRLYYSPVWSAMLGYEEKELGGSLEVWEELVHPEDLESAKKSIYDYMSGKVPEFSVEFRMKHKEGYYVDILSRGKLIRRKKDQEPVRFIGTHSDLTEIRQKERDLHLFKELIENSSHGCGLGTLDGKVYYANPSLMRFLEIDDLGEVIGNDIADFYPDEIKKKINNEIIPQVMDKGSWSGETSLQSKSGKIIPIMENYFVIHDSKGQPICLADVMVDISTVKKAEQELKKALELNEAIIHTSPVGIGIYDSSLRCTYVNDAFAEIIGLPAEEIVRQSDIHIPFWKETGTYEKAVHTLESKETLRFEDHTVLPSGKTAWFDCRMTAIGPSENRLLLLMMDDITREKETFLALQENEARLKEFFDMTGDLVTRVDKEGNFLFLNKAAKKIYGADPEECIGKPAFNFIHPDDKSHTHESFEQWIKNRETNASFRNRQISRDGRVSEMLWSISPKFDEDGNLLHIWSIARDISEISAYEKQLKEARDEIRIEKEFSETVINSLPGVFYLFDSNMNFVLWNQNFEQVTGYSPRELSQLSPLDLFSDEEAQIVAGRIGEVFSQGRASIEANFITRDGSQIPYYLTGLQIKIREKIYLAGIGIDLTDRKTIEQERERLLGELQERIKEQECIFTVSREIEASNSTDELFPKAIEAIKKGWQYPDITRCRIIFDGKSYTNLAFGEGVHKITSEVSFLDEIKGSIEVHYIEARSEADEGPFLKEERELLDLVAAKLGEADARYQSRKETQARQEIGLAFLEHEDEAAYAKALQAILKAVTSHYGMLGYIDQDGGMVYPSITREVWEKCAAEYKDIRFPRKTWGGLWGRSLLERKILFANEALPVPKGHIPIKNTITSPVMLGDDLVGHINIANNESDYDRNDIRMLENLAEYLAPIIEARRQEHFSRQALKLERNQLKALFDSTDDIIYVADPDTYDLVYVNKAARDIWGEDLIGLKCHKALQDRDEPCPFCTNEQIFGDNLGKTFVWEFQNEVTGRWYRCADKAITWADGREVRFEIATDITERKLFEQQQIRMEKFSALGKVAAGVAHELNNPLMGVLNYTEYCLEKTGEEDRRYEVLQDIRHETRRCAGIVENLLSASRIDGITSGETMKFQPEKVINQVVRLLEYRTSKEEVEVDWDAGSRVSSIKMSRDAFQQLVTNLFTNAIDAVEESKLKKIAIQLKDLDDRLVMKVSDTGCGISHDLQDKIFDPFYTTKAPGKGTGLGLATCWKIVNSQGGKIECTSRPGVGTTITLTLPLQAAEGKYQN